MPRTKWLPRCYLRFVLIRVGCAVVTARSTSIPAVRANCAQGGSPGTERNQPGMRCRSHGLQESTLSLSCSRRRGLLDLFLHTLQVEASAFLHGREFDCGLGQLGDHLLHEDK